MWGNHNPWAKIQSWAHATTVAPIWSCFIANTLSLCCVTLSKDTMWELYFDTLLFCRTYCRSLSTLSHCRCCVVACPTLAKYGQNLWCTQSIYMYWKGITYKLIDTDQPSLLYTKLARCRCCLVECPALTKYGQNLWGTQSIYMYWKGITYKPILTSSFSSTHGYLCTEHKTYTVQCTVHYVTVAETKIK